jgi:hypothetical protein
MFEDAIMKQVLRNNAEKRRSLLKETKQAQAAFAVVEAEMRGSDCGDS